MAKYRKTLFTLVGIAAGVFFVHPYVMLVHQFTDSGHGVMNTEGDVAVLFSAFTPAMLPMTVAFAFFPRDMTVWKSGSLVPDNAITVHKIGIDSVLFKVPSVRVLFFIEKTISYLMSCGFF